MEKSTYDSYLFYRFNPFDIVGIQTNDTLILANNDFVNKEEAENKVAKIMTKNQEYFTFTQPMKFNGVQIKLDSESIVLTKKSHIGGILLVTDQNADSISLREI